MGSPRVGHNWTTELIYMCVCIYIFFFFLSLFHFRLLQDILWVLHNWPLDYTWILYPRMGPFCHATGNLSHVSLSDTDYTMSIQCLIHPHICGHLGCCREPARDIPLVTKVMRKGAGHTQRRDRASGVPPDILKHLPPKKPESAYFIALCSHLWLYWGLSPTTISLSLSKS